MHISDSYPRTRRLALSLSLSWFLAVSLEILLLSSLVSRAAPFACAHLIHMYLQSQPVAVPLDLVRATHGVRHDRRVP